MQKKQLNFKLLFDKELHFHLLAKAPQAKSKVSANFIFGGVEVQNLCIAALVYTQLTSDPLMTPSRSFTPK